MKRWIRDDSGGAINLNTGAMLEIEYIPNSVVPLFNVNYIPPTGYCRRYLKIKEDKPDCEAFIAALVEELNAPDKMPTDDEVHAMAIYIEYRKYCEKQPKGNFDYEVVRTRLEKLENAVRILRSRGVLLEDVR